jgi:hypothetical protein
MNGDAPQWFWPTLFMLGAYHGINPGMGWLFAVALGMQEKSGRAVGRALVPLGLGHTLAVGLVVALASLAQIVIPVSQLRIIAATFLLGFGLYFLFRKKHLSWGGMRVGFADLTIWGFLMASAHGAGLMILPVLFGALTDSSPAMAALHEHSGHSAMWSPVGSWLSIAVVVVHLAGYLIVAGLAAWVVYAKFGLALLRKAWLNLDFAWAVALVVSGVVVLVV